MPDGVFCQVRGERCSRSAYLVLTQTYMISDFAKNSLTEFENGLILHGCAADVPRNYLDHDWFFFDPCWEIVNSVNGFCDLKEPPVISVQIPPVATQASGEELLDDEENSAIEEVDDIGHRGGYY